MIFFVLILFLLANFIFNRTNLVSAQEEILSEEDLEKFRSHVGFKDGNGENFSDSKIIELVTLLGNAGYLSRANYGNPDSVIEAINKVTKDYNNALETGENVDELIALYVRMSYILELIPITPSISEADLEQSLREEVLHTCPEDKNGKICQPYAGNVCDESCKVRCIDINLLEQELPEDSQCKLGTCYDKIEGSCQARAPRAECPDNDNSKWYPQDDRESEELCKPACCLIGEQTLFITERKCEKRAEDLGLEFGSENAVWKSEINRELECVAEGIRLRNEKELGACVYDSEGEIGCKFVTGAECAQIGGDFNSNQLCSNPGLNTKCTKQNYTGCVEGLDEVYWFDSCGNRENIYEGSSNEQKEFSYNNGMIKKKEESCELGDATNPLKNQGTCGNCNRFKSSICGEESEGQELNDNPDGNAVCIDMGCVDEKGKRREHGESWCAYQSSIGLDGPVSDNPITDILFGNVIPQFAVDWIGGDRSTDTPGSSHFLKSCKRGKIETETCEVGRKKICVEDRIPVSESSKTISKALCRPNRWEQCFAYNPGQAEGFAISLAGPQGAWKILKTKLDLTCGLEPDCFVKDVDLTEKSLDTFKFSYCAPRYPEGFELRNPESGKAYCQQASQTCVAVFVKWTSGWKCEANCKCVTGNDPSSAKPSQDFTIAMNNFCTSLGDCGSSVNYVGDSPGGKGYSITTGESITERFRSSFNGFTDLTNLIDLGLVLSNIKNDDEPKRDRYIRGNYTLPDGYAINELNQFLEDHGIIGLFVEIDGKINQALGQIGQEGVNKVPGYSIPDVPLGIRDNWVWKVTGMFIYDAIFGWGEVKEVHINFECKPWVAPKGGSSEKCRSCGKDKLSDGGNEFPCNKYSCEALGQDCIFINGSETREGGICEYVASDDTNAPRIITLRQDILTENFEYKNFEQGNIISFDIERKNLGCMSQFNSLRFGFEIDEFGECRIKAVHPEGKFDEMSPMGSGINHTIIFSPLDLENLGYKETLNVEQENEIKLYAACQDYRGNNNANNPFLVNLCVSPRDLQVPYAEIMGDETPLPYNASKQVIVVRTDEDAECRWDYSNKNFDSMSNEMDCNFINECIDTITLQGTETNVCIKCKDHPEWQGTEREDERNVWTECIDSGITLRRSESMLEIKSIKPNNEKVSRSALDSSLTIEVETSGGVDGTADCYWSLDNAGEILFEETGGRTLHTQCLGCGTAFLEAGTHTLDIKCIDKATNEANISTTFIIEIDTTPPKVTRVYSESGDLVVITNEPANCAYVNAPIEGRTNACNFKVEEGEVIGLELGSNQMKHATTFEEDKVYYIKCKDHPEWKDELETQRNEPSDCNIIVSSGLF